MVRADSGDDTLIYVASENVGASDTYVGSIGEDTLLLILSEAEFEDATLQNDLARLDAFIETKGDATSYGGPSFFFNSFNLSIQAIEDVDVFVFDPLIIS